MFSKRLVLTTHIPTFPLFHFSPASTENIVFCPQETNCHGHNLSLLLIQEGCGGDMAYPHLPTVVLFTCTNGDKETLDAWPEKGSCLWS